MDNQKIKKYKNSIIDIGRLMWNRDMASAMNGNISLRVKDDKILLTASKTCLGRLEEKDILLLKLDGAMLEEGKVSTEKILHLEIYKNFPDARAIIHTHPPYTNGYFLSNKSFLPYIFESKLYLGRINSVEQKTPNVSDLDPVIDELKSNNIVVLRNHGSLAMGESLFDCFCLLQSLEEAIKVDVVRRLYSSELPGQKPQEEEPKALAKDPRSKFKLFSQEQIDEIVRLVNNDQQLQELGKKTVMTMELAVKLNENGTVYSFKFEEGKIIEVGHNDAAEFVVSAPESVWRQVFNREIDPFVATTQKKMNLEGDFAHISKWYAPCSRLFELWAQVPVE